MTADAKIGLLLGLFFIVVIAFLINGLPNFIRQNESKPMDVAITTSQGSEMIIDSRLTDTVHRLRPQVELRQTEPPQEVLVIDPAAPRPAPQVEIPAGPQPQPEKAVAEVPSSQRTAEMLQPPLEPKPAQPAAEKTKTHVVQSGEYLSTIAQKYYGKEEGNRRIVIQKLYELNAKTLKSPDQARVGDKLVIPPLNELLGTAKPVAKTPQPSETLLNKFSGILERVSKEDTPKMSEYVVKEGDSLWSISQKMLGDGKRYTEIQRLNKDQIKSVNDVNAGMKLKIPTR